MVRSVDESGATTPEDLTTTTTTSDNSFEQEQQQQQYQQQHYYRPNSYFNYRGRGRYGQGDRRSRVSRPPHPMIAVRPPHMDPQMYKGGHVQNPWEGEQMYIISGPFATNGQCTMIAYPIPKGSTVIATPSVRGQVHPVQSFPAVRPPPGAMFSVPEARPMLHPPPMSPGLQQNLPQQGPTPGIRNPSVLVWNAHAPEGRLVPLRQMQPPVYFYPNGVAPVQTEPQQTCSQ